MKKVLIITYYWPPSGGSGVQRWLKFAKYLPKYGWQPIIYTPSNPENPATDTSLEREVPEEAVVIRRPISEPYQIYKKFFSRGGGVQKGGSAVVNPINQSGKKSFLQKVSLWIRANIFIPDPRISWVRPSVSYLTEYLDDTPVDAIISTGPPHSMHLIARELHRRTGISWVADFRDPWTEIFYFKHLPMTSWARKRHKKLERSVVREADAVVSVTRQMTADFANTLETCKRSKLHTICNGYDDTDFILPDPVVPDPKFTLVHTGLFSADGNPVRLWEVLREMCERNPNFRKDLRIRLAGKVDKEVLESIGANSLEGNLENLGYLPHNTIPRLQQCGWALLLPLRNEPESKAILTGKFFEYLAAGRPVVAFGPKDGEMAKVLGETRSGVIFEWDEKDPLRQHMEALYNDFRMGNHASSKDESLITKYSRRSLIGEMVKVIEGVIEARQKSKPGEGGSSVAILKKCTEFDIRYFKSVSDIQTFGRKEFDLFDKVVLETRQRRRILTFSGTFVVPPFQEIKGLANTIYTLYGEDTKGGKVFSNEDLYSIKVGKWGPKWDAVTREGTVISLFWDRESRLFQMVVTIL